MNLLELYSRLDQSCADPFRRSSLAEAWNSAHRLRSSDLRIDGADVLRTFFALELSASASSGGAVEIHPLTSSRFSTNRDAA